MREKLLADKAEAIQQELVTWAAEQAILKPGERVVFSMRIEKVSTVVQGIDVSIFLEMTVEDFFSPRRLESFGVPKFSISRISHQTQFFTRRRDETTGEFISPTMREFLVDYPNVTKLKRINNIGEKSIQGIIMALQAAGLPFDTNG